MRQIFTATLGQLRTMTAEKQARGEWAPGRYWFVPSHPHPHFDESVGYEGLLKRGEVAWPGISEADFVMVPDANDVTEQQFLDIGGVPVGTGHGRYDEHGRGLNTCAADLVFRDPELNFLNGLKKESPGKRVMIRGIPETSVDQVLMAAWHNLVRYTNRGDNDVTRDVHAAQNDVKTRWNIAHQLIVDGKHALLPTMLRPPAEYVTGDDAWQRACERNFQRVRDEIMDYLTEDWFFLQCVYDLTRRGQLEWQTILLTEWGIPISLAVIRGEMPAAIERDVVKVARHIGAKVVFKRSPQGHVGLFPQKRDEGLWSYVQEMTMDPEIDFRNGADRNKPKLWYHINTDPVRDAWRLLEADHAGSGREFTKAELAAEHCEGSRVVGVRKSGIVLAGGSQDSGIHNPPFPVPDGALLEALLSYLTITVIKDESKGGDKHEEGVEAFQPDEQGVIRPTFV